MARPQERLPLPFDVPTGVKPNVIAGHDVPWYSPTLAYPISLKNETLPGQPYLHITVVDPVVNYNVKFVMGLYLPNSCRVMYDARWEELDMEFLGSLVRFTKSEFWTLPEIAEAQKEGGYRMSKNVSDQFLSSQVFSELEKQRGKMLNPHAAVIFKGMGFRGFQFNFTFMPKNPSESKEVKSIIYAFKYAMHPELTGRGDAFSSGFMNYPWNFLIDIFAPNGLLLFRTSVMALLNAEVEYCAAGRPAFFQRTDDPVAINLNLTFKEMEILTRERIAQGY